MEWHTVVAISPSSAGTVVVILVEESSTARVTLRDTLFIGGGIHLNTRGVALQQGLILDSPSDNIDIDRLVREPIEAGQFGYPFVERPPHGRLDLFPLCLGHRLGGVPPHAIVDFALAVDDLVVSVVAESERVAVG